MITPQPGKTLLAQLAVRPSLSIEMLTLIVSLWFTVTSNPLFWSAVLDGHNKSATGLLTYALALAVLLTALHFALMAIALTRHTAKPILAALIIATAFSAYYMSKYHVYLDPGMLRNVLNTDYREASELISWGMLLVAAYALPPLLLVYRARLPHHTIRRAIGIRARSLLVAALLAFASGFFVFQDMSSLLREKHALRFLITPGNFIYSTARVLAVDSGDHATTKTSVGSDAVLGPSWPQRKKPVLMVVVIGETARAANWGLSGYSRQTTPELAALDVINFPDVTACGTSTEVSLPCMLSAIGRRDYDEARIRGSESLPHVLQHSGFKVSWLDNQSGCKGTCSGLDYWRPDVRSAPADCVDAYCFDEALLVGARKIVEGSQENHVLFLHTLGNHGPAYFKRYPARFRQFSPACETTDLGHCAREEIVNAYDNAILYTDHVLAQTVAFLNSRQESHDTAMIYVSDHGESLGENGIFLHGMPYAIAPDLQKKVPMVLWLSTGYAKSFDLDTGCLRQRALSPATHTHLFHSVLGMLDVTTSAHDAQVDFVTGCRRPPREDGG